MSPIFKSMPTLIAGVTLSGAMTGIILAYGTRGSAPLSESLWLPLLAITGAALATVCWYFCTMMLASHLRQTFRSTCYQTTWAWMALAILPALFFPYAHRQPGSESSSAFPVAGAASSSLFILFLAILLVISLHVYQIPQLQIGPIRKISHRPKLFLLAMIVIWTIGAAITDSLKTFYLHETISSNTPLFVEALRNAFSEQGPLYSQLMYANGSSFLGQHSGFILFLVYPLFRLWPSYQWFLTLTNLALALTAIPIYYLSRRYFDPGLSLLLAAVFLMNRTILSQPVIGDSSEIRFLPVLLLSAVYFWQMRKFKPFIVFSILSIFVREDIGVIILTMGILSLINKQGLKWIIAPLFLGAASFVAATFWIIPSLSPIKQSRMAIHYGFLGETDKDILLNLLLHPWIVVKSAFATSRHFATVYAIWQSFGFGVFLFSGSILLAIPILLETLLFKYQNLTLFNSIAIAATMFPPFIFGLSRFDSFTRRYWKRGFAGPIVLITLFSTLALSHTWIHPARVQPRYNYDAAIEIMNQIPPDASVMLPYNLVVKASPSQQVRSYAQIRYHIVEEDFYLAWDYIVIDETQVEAETSDVGSQDNITILKTTVQNSPDYVNIYARDDLELYVRRSPMATETTENQNLRF